MSSAMESQFKKNHPWGKCVHNLYLTAIRGNIFGTDTVNMSSAISVEAIIGQTMSWEKLFREQMCMQKCCLWIQFSYLQIVSKGNIFGTGTVISHPRWGHNWAAGAGQQAEREKGDFCAVLVQNLAASASLALLMIHTPHHPLLYSLSLYFVFLIWLFLFWLLAL